MQKTLFSFFKKPTKQEGTTTPAPASNASKKEPALSASDNLKSNLDTNANANLKTNDSNTSDSKSNNLESIKMKMSDTPVSLLKPKDDVNNNMDVEVNNDIAKDNEKRPRFDAASGAGLDGDSSPEVVVKRSKLRKISKDSPKKSTTKKSNKKSKGSDDEEAEWDGEDSDSDASDDNDDDESFEDENVDSDAESMGDNGFIADSDSDDDGGGYSQKTSKKRKNTSLTSSKKNIKSMKTPSSASASSSTNGKSSATIQVTLSGNAVGANGTPSQDALYLCDRMLSNPSGVGQTQTKSAGAALPDGVTGLGNHEHDRLTWLRPENRKDKKGRKMDHPDYDPRTLYVPEKFLKEQSPAMAQWWELKSANFDVCLFFKVGKFYELYHMDADTGMTELELVFMKGQRAHSGFPEVSYGKYAEMLVRLGHKVARVEQVETPDQLKERNSQIGKGKKDKVVRRELCSVLTKGTRTYCHMDDLTTLIANEKKGVVGVESSSVLMCIKEKCNTSTNTKDMSDTGSVAIATEYGVCIVDSVLGHVTLAQFQDDNQRSRLRTLVARYMPTEVLLEHNRKEMSESNDTNTSQSDICHSQETIGCIQLMAPKATFDYLRGSEMPNVDKVKDMIIKGKYYIPEPGSAASKTEGDVSAADETRWPTILRAVIAGVHDGSSALVMASLGGAIWHMKRSLIDYEVMSVGKIYGYVPPDESVQGNALATTSMSTDDDSTSTDGTGPEHLVLDAVSLSNLEILVTTFDRSEKGSLYHFVNRCKTAFGRRLLKDWLCKPLCRPGAINRRADAIKELNASDIFEYANKTRSLLSNIPDLERLLQRVHTTGSKRLSTDHPDGRAVMFEEGSYNKKKIKDFVATLDGFDKLLKAGDSLLQSSNIESEGLKTLLDKFPAEEMRALLKHFKEIFEAKKALDTGKITPRPGMDDAYDEAKKDEESITVSLEDHLRDMKRKIGLSSLKFFGTNKDRFQIEVPIGDISRVPSSWQLKSQKKTARRYWTPFIIDTLTALVDAEGRREEAQKDTMRRLFAKFDDSHTIWKSAVECVAQLDCLLSLANVSSAPGYVWPEIQARQAGTPPLLDIVNGRHPMLEFSMQSKGEGEYIPNGLRLGGFDNDAFNPRLLLLSGPNMGGKSTLLRQTCLITILSQLGCAVPADKCVMTPVDRIFTRVGASDRILAGQSTFFVELAETATILHAATEDSLCILDELGRGTATHDGTAIAHAVVDRLARITRCRTLFATHYHSLVDDWGVDPRIQLGHMDCMVTNEDTTKVSDQEVTFLYRLASGSSPKSYGVNVARLARLPPEVIALAAQQSQDFEARMTGNTNGDGHNIEGRGAAALIGKNRDTAATFFDRLLSITKSDMGVEELAYVTKELWQRYKTITGSSNNNVA